MSPHQPDLAIAGLGVITGRNPEHSQRMMAAEAARLAIEDAGLTRADIDGAVDLRRTGGGGDRVNYVDSFSRVLGLPANFYFVIGRGGALAGLGIAAAAGYLQRGLANYVLLVGSADDWSRSRRTRLEGHRGMVNKDKEGYWGKPLGDIRAVSHHSWMAARHMAVYGTTSEQFGAIAVQQRQWACLNPEAVMYGKPITIADHQASPLVVDPYHLLDICQVSDGAVAFVLTTRDRARDLPKPPVLVMGQGFGEVASQLWWENKNFTHMAVANAKKQAFAESGIQLGDIKVAELYDCFTAEVMLQLEDYGWCAKGEGGPFVAAGTIGPGGTIPVNTGGGLLSSYHLGDLTPFAEAVRQVRGEAGDRQIADCDVALATGHGGELVSPGMCSIHTTTILGRDR